MMVDANWQREELLPSEKAYAYKMRYDAMRHQGERTDLKASSQNGTGSGKGNTSSRNGTRSRSDIELAEQVGESRNQLQRYMSRADIITRAHQQLC